MGETMPKEMPHREYERVASPGDEDYKNDDPIQRRAATEQRGRDYFVSCPMPNPCPP